jgi:hypothetical protein
MCKPTGKTVVAKTKKGSRVWLQGLSAYGWAGGEQYSVAYTPDSVVLTKSTEGKRKVTASKGGVIDLESKKVQSTFDGVESVVYTIESNQIVIKGE